MVAFIVGNSDPNSPILTTADMPQSIPSNSPVKTLPHEASPRIVSESHTHSSPALNSSSSSSSSPSSSPASSSSPAEVVPQQPLIPGIPDDMARKCLARVPFWYHSGCKAVSRGWKSMYSEPEILKLRKAEGVKEEYLISFFGNPSVCQGQLFYPLLGKWRKIPATPVELHSYGLECFGVVATQRYVFLIGGVLFDARSYPTDFPVPSKDVYRYDLIRNKWEKVAPMLEARGSVACAVALVSHSKRAGEASSSFLRNEDGGQGAMIYVAGGDGRYGQKQRRWSHLSSAEVYDTDEDVWVPLPPMESLRAGSSAAFVEDKFAVFGGYGTPRLIAGFLQVSEQRQDSEVYIPEQGEWSKRRLAWFPEDNVCTGPVTQLGGDVFMLLGNTILRLQLSSSVWCHETTLDWSDRDASFFALQGELHVVPSDKVSSVYQKQFSYDPVAQSWRTSKVRQKLRYVRTLQACKQPFRTAALISL